MSTIVLRQTKGSALTFAEGDANFSNLNNDKLEDITNESIGDLSDVTTTTPSEGQVLTWTASGQWENQDASAGATQLSELSDVDSGLAPSNGQVLVWNNSNMAFEAQTLSIPSDIDDLSNVTINSPTAGQILTYNNSFGDWRNTDLSVSQAVNDLTDVSITSPSDLQILVYSSGTWVNASPNLNALSDVALTSTASNQILSYNGSQFVNTSKIENIEIDNYKETVYALGSNDSPSIDAANGNVQTVTISAGLDIPDISNFDTGATVTLIVYGNGTATDNTTSTICQFANAGSTDLTNKSIVSIFNDGSNYLVSIATDYVGA
jgi:hypothetical protein